jgi:proline dehydrogenase
MLHASISSSANTHDGFWPPVAAIASHDERRVNFAKAHAAEIGLPKAKLEFQMLYGIRREMQRRLRDEGYPVRIYVPFGTEWYPYFMRRLAERPANLWFFLTSLFRG